MHGLGLFVVAEPDAYLSDRARTPATQILALMQVERVENKSESQSGREKTRAGMSSATMPTSHEKTQCAVRTAPECVRVVSRQCFQPHLVNLLAARVVSAQC